jgi:hypothetical protein
VCVCVCVCVFLLLSTFSFIIFEQWRGTHHLKNKIPDGNTLFKFARAGVRTLDLFSLFSRTLPLNQIATLLIYAKS